MNIWVVRQTFVQDGDSWVTTHLTEKGALMTAIDIVRDDLADGFDEDELEDYRPGMPHDPHEDLKQYGKEQLRGIVQDWWEYSFDMNDCVQYQIHETQVMG